MTDPAPDTQQIEMLKTLLHDSRTERTRLADEVDRLRALADPAPVGLTEDERLHMTNLREAWRRAAPVYTDLAATDVEWLCTLIDRLSPGVVEPPEERQLLNGPTLIDEDGVEHICHALIEVGPWDEIDGDGTEASIIADHIRDLARLLAPPPGDGWWDTGHTSTACGCNHHWDAHTPFRGCSVCSCKLDPPNQPPPSGEPESEKP